MTRDELLRVTPEPLFGSVGGGCVRALQQEMNSRRHEHPMVHDEVVLTSIDDGRIIGGSCSSEDLDSKNSFTTADVPRNIMC